MSRMRIQFVTIPVADQSRAKSFYVDVLGWTCDADHESAPGRRFVDITPAGGGPGIALMPGRDRRRPVRCRGSCSRSTTSTRRTRSWQAAA